MEAVEDGGNESDDEEKASAEPQPDKEEQRRHSCRRVQRVAAVPREVVWRGRTQRRGLLCGGAIV